jgi:hypothetical protein
MHLKIGDTMIGLILILKKNRQWCHLASLAYGEPMNEVYLTGMTKLQFGWLA